MNEFNFYINVDECLNMSTFEMFFYKLQNDHKFYVVEASFNDTAGKGGGTPENRSIQNALYKIKNYIGQSSHMIRDYRLIFGVRQRYKKEVPWKETVLYRLLKIHYCMQNAKVFIKTKDRVDKNVTVILLYDVENTLDEKRIGDEIEDHTFDLPALMEYLGVDWGEAGTLPSEREIIENMKKASIEKKDAVTIQFLNDFYEWYTTNKLYEESRKEPPPPPSPKKKDNLSEEQRNRVARFNNIHNLVAFTSETVSAFSVFTKKISSDTAEHRLALLGIVDYITTGLAGNTDGKDENDINSTLKQKARENWKNAKDDEVIWKKYGNMMMLYEERMSSRQREMAGRYTNAEESLKFNVEEPARFLCEFDGTEYEKKITGILEEYERSVHTLNSEKSWDDVEKQLKELLGRLEVSLEKFSETLSSLYKSEIRQRNDKRAKEKTDNRIYDTDQIDEVIRKVNRRKEELLEDLKRQKMIPHVTYDDQLYVDLAIRTCSKEIHYYRKRRDQIRLANFILLFLTAGGFVLLSHLLLQESLFSDMWNLAGAGLSAAAAALLMVFAWGAPGIYYRARMTESTKQLKKDLIKFTRGYNEIARNFEEYMNNINAIDVMNHYLQDLEDMRTHSTEENRKFLWHKEAIGRHLQKCSFFSLLYNDRIRGYSIGSRYSASDIELDYNYGVIENPFYWPQQINGGSE